MATKVMRITLKAYDHNQIDHAAGKIIDTVKKTGAKVTPAPCAAGASAGRYRAAPSTSAGTSRA